MMGWQYNFPKKNTGVCLGKAEKDLMVENCEERYSIFKKKGNGVRIGEGGITVYGYKE